MEDAPINQELLTVDRKFINELLGEMEGQLKLSKELLKLAEKVYGINDENVISIRAYTTEQETILQKSQTTSFITMRDFDSFFDMARMREITKQFKILDRVEQIVKELEQAA